jgi:hypothetical protein
VKPDVQESASGHWFSLLVQSVVLGDLLGVLIGISPSENDLPFSIGPGQKYNLEIVPEVETTRY